MPEPDPPPSTCLPAGSRFRLYLSFIFAGILTTWLGSLLPWLSSRWSLAPAAAGNFFVAQFCGSSFGVLLGGWLLSRAGYRRILASGLGFMSIGVMGLAASAPAPALAGLALAGFGMGLVIPSGNLALAQAAGEHAATALNKLNLAWGAGALAAPGLVASLLHFGHQFWILALVAIAQLGLGLAFLCDTARWPNLTSTPWRLSINRRWGWLAWFIFLYVGCENSAGGWVATLGRELGLRHGHWLWLPLLFWTGLLGGRALAPLPLRHLPPLRLVRLSAGLALGGYLLLLAGSTPAWLVCGTLLTGLGLAAIFPIILAQIPQATGAESRVRNGDPWLFLFGGLGGAIMPALVGRIAGWQKPSAPLDHRMRLAMWLPWLGLACIFALIYRLKKALPADSRSALRSG